MDPDLKKLIAEVGAALREARRQHEALTMMFDSLVRGMDELEEQAEKPQLRSVS